MTTLLTTPDTSRQYAACIEASRKNRFDIDRDVIRGRTFDLEHKFLPDGLSFANELTFLTPPEQRLLSQVQGRSYANIFGLVERFIAAKVLEVSRVHWLGDQTALEALVRFTDEEMKHQELFRRVERLMAERMPAGYSCPPDPNAVANVVLGKSTWAVLALTCHIELFTLAHCRAAIDGAAELSPLWRDVFVQHAREEAQHAILDELEWTRVDRELSPAERDRAVNDLIDLVAAVDGILQAQAAADTAWFLEICGRTFAADAQAAIGTKVLAAYRWQYIGSGLQGRFTEVLASLITPDQMIRIQRALAPILG